MTIKIEDGRGKGKTAAVTESQELLVRSNTLTLEAAEAADGDTFFFATDIVEVSGTTERPILYVQNSAARDFRIGGLRMSSSLPAVFRVYAEPTSVENMVVSTARNSNLSSGKKFDGTFQVGTVTATSIGGNLFGQIRAVDVDRFDYGGEVIVGPGNSIMVTYALSAASDTNIGVTMVGFYHSASDD